jgi:hypothetical protein
MAAIAHTTEDLATYELRRIDREAYESELAQARDDEEQEIIDAEDEDRRNTELRRISEEAEHRGEWEAVWELELASGRDEVTIVTNELRRTFTFDMDLDEQPDDEDDAMIIG